MVAQDDEKMKDAQAESSDRRQFLRGSALFGAGMVASRMVTTAHAEDAKPRDVELPSDDKAPTAAASTATAPATQYGPGGVKGSVAQVYQKAREVLYPRCRVCPQCDGVACAGEYPGFGGLGSGQSFQNNFKDLQKVRLRLRALNGVLNVDKRPDTSTVILGHKLSFPAMAAPIGGVAGNFGGKLSDVDYFEAIIGGCADAGTLGSVGDSPADPEEVLKARFAVIGRNDGRAIAGIKPRPQDNFIEMIRLAESVNAALITIDIDSAGRYGNQPNKRTQVGPKTVAELRQLARATKIPLLVKGIMTPEDALAAIDSGAAGIVVSNHGGRVLDHTPGTAEVLPAIAAKVNGKVPILVDGCVHYGVDVVKYLALGASAVLVGRHIARAAFGGGRQGVALFMDTMRGEFEAAMVMVGAANVRSVNRSVLV